MWWGTAGNGYGMPHGMFMMPLFFLILIAIMIYFFNRSDSSHRDHRCNYYEDKYDSKNEVLREVRDLKEEIRELKKQKE